MGSRRRDRDLSGAALLLGLLAAWSGAAAAAPARGWLTAAGGAESDLTLDSGPTPAVVPGGPFLSFIGGLGGGWGAPGRTRLDLGAQGWYERYTEAGGRRVLSLVGLAGLDLALGRRWSARIGAGAHHFDDSARTAVRRDAGWAEAGLVWAPGPWRLEVQGGLEGRRYPLLALPDEHGATGVYTELQTNAGAHAEVRLAGRLRLRGAGHARRTEARDPLYNASGPTFEAGADVLLGAGLRLLLDGFLQERRFTDRPPGQDRDRYRQAGAALEADLGPRWSVRAQVAVSRYTWPDGLDVDTSRWQVGVTRRFGGPRPTGLPEPGRLPRDETPGVPRAGRPFEFRLHAPDARSASLVGDFNGWDPQADPLHRAGGGWWRTTRSLPAGTHAYAYVVDGAWITPPEAAVTATDGFGGRNGLLVVLP